MLATLAILSWAVLIFGVFDAIKSHGESTVLYSVDEEHPLARIINLDRL